MTIESKLALAFVLLALVGLSVSVWRLRRRVTMLETTLALSGPVPGYGVTQPPHELRVPQQARAPRREP